MTAFRILTIRTPNAEILRKKCNPVTWEEDGGPIENIKIGDGTTRGEIQKILGDMITTVRKCGGVGLAANQVGIDARIIVVDSFSIQTKARGATFMINPEITWVSEEKVTHEEGCLSLPLLTVDVERPVNIEVKYFDQYFKEQVYRTESSKENIYDSIFARVVQHEVEHLDGGLIIDHLPELTPDVKRILGRIERGQTSVKYQTLSR